MSAKQVREEHERNLLCIRYMEAGGGLRDFQVVAGDTQGQQAFLESLCCPSPFFFY